MQTLPSQSTLENDNRNPVTARAFEHYQGTLPYVRAHEATGQYQLWGGGIPDPPRQPLALCDALIAAAELVKLEPLNLRQLQLFAPDGVIHGAKWRRRSAGAKWRTWAELDSAIAARARFSGRKWTTGDLRTLADIEAQCWGVSELHRDYKRVVWLGDGIVCPLTGDWIPIPRKAGLQLILNKVVRAAVAGAGGVILTRVQWAAQLKCSPRTVYNWMRVLVELGLLRVVYLRQPAEDGEGSRKGRYLWRVGPRLEALAAVECFAIRKGVSLPDGLTRDTARRWWRQLERRQARREFDVAGAYYRGGHGRARCARTDDLRTREGCSLRGAKVLPGAEGPFPKRQKMPQSPPLAGLSDQSAPPEGRERAFGPRKDLRSAKGTTLAGPAAVLPTPASASTVTASGDTGRVGAVATEGEAQGAPPDLERSEAPAIDWQARFPPSPGFNLENHERVQRRGVGRDFAPPTKPRS